jgi:uncharacterized protein (TIGR04255 family)
VSEKPADPLPDFDAPPINEVVLGVQSDQLNMATPFVGLYWARVRDIYPKWEVQGALDQVIERFGERPQTIGPAAGLRVMDKPETPRCWFIDATGNRLIQLQQDRLIHNWRRINESDAYPRYWAVREGFAEEYRRLETFVKDERVGDLTPDWCEVTYINHIPRGSGWERHGELHRVFEVISSPTGRFLPEPEQGAFAFAYRIDDDTRHPVGRLHVSAKPGIRRRDEMPLLILDLTARGQPEGKGLEGVLRFMDRAHEWIVRGFTDLTRPAMQSLWRRRNA